jgi:hypothetical protein
VNDISNKKVWRGLIGFLSMVMVVIHAEALAFEVTDKLSIGGVLAGAYQYQEVSGGPGFGDTGRGAVPFQPEITYTATDKDEFFAKFGFTAGNGLNEVSPFVLAPWAADLEDDVRDINGRNRDYLLTVWYKHTFHFGDDNMLGLTGGLIDATDYLDDNAYSNDEYTQFMNQALVNGPNAFLPSYDIGGAMEWDISNFSLRGVVMSIGSNDDGNAFTFYGLQVGYNLKSSFGAGNYRMVFAGSSKDFLDPEGTRKEDRRSVILSFDQELGEILGGWLRFGHQDDDAAINFQSLYSGGIQISGKLWGRENDNIGVGYAYLDGGNLDIDKTQVAEGYIRFQLTHYFALTADLQYMKDDIRNGESPKGWICGLRLAAEF